MRLSREHIPDRLISAELSGRHFFVLSSRMAKFAFREFFNGTGFTAGAIVMENDGFAAYKAAHPGCLLSLDLIDGGYTIGEYFASRFVIRTDVNGHDILYLWRNGAEWALSNSPYVLAREIEALGHCPTLYPPALAVFSMGEKDRDHGQLISRNTCIDGACLLPPHAAVWITFTDKGPSVEIEQTPRLEPGMRSLGLYRHRLLDFVSTWRDRFQTFGATGLPLNLSLSGGKDSRSVLAMLLSVPELRFHAHTWKTKSQDHDIAFALIQEHGLGGSLVPPPQGPAPSASEFFALNMMAGAGVRRFNYGMASTVQTDRILLSGAAAFDSVVARSPLTKRFRNATETGLAPKAIRDHAVQEYLIGAQDLPCDAESKDAILFHYGAYRGRFHYGRGSLMSNSLPLMPLFTQASMRLVLSASEFRYVRMSGVNYDLVSFCAPGLLKYPFTGPQEMPLLASRDMSRHDLPEPRELRVFGTRTIPGQEDFARVAGPDGIQILRTTLEPAIQRFGDYFADHVIASARTEVAEDKPLEACRNATLLCGLSFLFPDD